MPAVRSLLDSCAKRVAETLPFHAVEDRLQGRIPEPVQERIIFWSFPRDEHHVRMYSSMDVGQLQVQQQPQHAAHNSNFQRGVKLVEQNLVRNVLQIGFHLSGEVVLKSSSSVDEEKKEENNTYFKVSMGFDRCKITSTNCGCEARDIFWCCHVVALALHRIRHAERVKLRVPISESLLQMSREQLQKLAQYLISAHHTDVLPTAQSLADQILQEPEGEINRIAGAPDPTAGEELDRCNRWHFDEDQVKQQVRNLLSSNFSCNRQFINMFSKVREMLRARDDNGVRILTLITEQFLADPRLVLWRSQASAGATTASPMTEKCRQLWDYLGALWVSVALDPLLTPESRTSMKMQLESWARIEVCPLEDPDFRPSSLSDAALKAKSRDSRRRRRRTGGGGGGGQSEEEDENHRPANDQQHRERGHHRQHRRRHRRHRNKPRSIFHKALDALHMNWSNPQLRVILTSDCKPTSQAEKDICSLDDQGRVLWPEHLPTACARVEALRTHGFHRESLRLAVAVARTMKTRQLDPSPVWEGWIGHTLNPIGCLFDTLIEPGLSAIDRAEFAHPWDPVDGAPDGGRPNHTIRYKHVQIAGSHEDEADTYMTLAVEAALIGLAQHRLMPPGLYAQEKTSKQEERLLSRLRDIEPDSRLIQVLKRQSELLLEASSSGLSLRVHPESVPMQNFAKFLFLAVLPTDASLAFRIGLRSMRLPVLEMPSSASASAKAPDGSAASSSSTSTSNSASAGASAMADFSSIARIPRWFTLGQIESQQGTLASTLFVAAAKGDPGQLPSILEAVQKHIHSPSHLFKLAQEALRHAGEISCTSTKSSLLDVAFKLGVRVTRLTLTSLNWRRRDVVRWIVSCAGEVGSGALMSLLQGWKSLFTPTEAAGTVATTVMSHATIVRSALTFTQQEELASCARTLALQCAHEDPAGCSLNALTLCENEPIAFETAYQIVVDAAVAVTTPTPHDHRVLMTSSQLFTVARYMEHRGYPHRAFKLALLALRGIRLAYNQDAHPVIADVLWASMLSQSLGKAELTAMIPLIVANVQCATVLADILKRCCCTPHSLSASEENGPLKQLLEAATSAFVATTHSRLSSISPRHYTEFIDFLSKARETFLLAADGHAQFLQLIENMKSAYKGKKKLICLIQDRFGHS